MHARLSQMPRMQAALSLMDVFSEAFGPVTWQGKPMLLS